MAMMSRIRGAWKRRAAYLRTKRELQRMPIDVALDLDLDPGNPSRTARWAVYG